ncbi:MAG TPA: DUF2510 domain-containing protein [Acidimicrobiales bacterium]|nr:DUF2510 domain-containing protein [Acidimicrobiales bacterium]
MTATSAEPVNLALALLSAVVLLAVVLGAVDVIRQPRWAWRAAGEPKLLSLALVLLLPGVGLAIYVFGARPKVLAVASAGRAANLPFERFGDRQALATESTRSIQALTLPTTLGSFGERRTTRPVRAGGPGARIPSGGGFFEDPDLVTASASAGADPDPAAAPAPTATAEPTIRIPGSVGRPYHPRQRTSFEEDESPASVAASILGATTERTGPAPTPTADAVTQPTGWSSPGGPSASAHAAPSVEPAPGAQVSGPTFTAPDPVHGFGHRSGAHGPSAQGAATQLAAAPVATPGTPEIFRPRPEQVAPIAGAASTAVATMARRTTMAARWLPDPTGRHQYRYWDGGCWTENVYDAGVESRDPVAD